MRAIGSIHSPGDRKMWLDEPHERVILDKDEVDEWLRLIREAGLK
jgi:hypothetical protein